MSPPLTDLVSSIFRPYAPQIIPVLVCILLIPLVLFLSALAGFLVWKGLATGWEEQIYLQYGDGVPPYAQTIIPELVSLQRYDISLHLTIPATESNFALGNFMTSLTLTTLSNKTLSSVRRPAIPLPSRSSLFPFARAPPLVNIHVPLLNAFVPGTSKVLARIEIGRRDNWMTIGIGQGRELSVLYASLRGVVIPHGIRGLAIRFPIIMSLLSAGTFLLIISALLGSCILPMMIRRTEKKTQEKNKMQGEGKIEEEPWTLPRASSKEKIKRRRRSRLSRSLSDRSQPSTKTEGPVADIPPIASPTTEKLRRRTSHQFERRSDSDE